MMVLNAISLLIVVMGVAVSMKVKEAQSGSAQLQLIVQ
jgi:hypothetical protein